MKAHVAIACSIALAVSSVAAAQTAEEHYDRGQTAYDARQYAQAAKEWEASFALAADAAIKAEIRYNIAQAHRFADDCTNAIASYKNFLELAPNSKKAPLAKQFLEELEPNCQANPIENRDATAAPVATEVTKSHPAEWRSPGFTEKVVGIGVAGAGAILLGVGAYYGHRVSSLDDQVTSACASGCDWGVLQSKDAEGRRAQTRQLVSYGLGLAAIGAGAFVYWLGMRDDATSVVVTPVKGGAGVTWSGRW